MLAFDWNKITRVFPGLWMILGVMMMIALANLYSASGGKWTPWVVKQALYFLLGLGGMMVVIALPLRLIFEASYMGYAIGLGLLFVVEFMGLIGMGAQRWIDLKIIHIQPSEMMKIALIIALARFLAVQDAHFWRRPQTYLGLLFFLVLPVLLILKQPDLGTALFLLGCGGMIVFVAGLPLWFILAVAVSSGGAAPFLWSCLHDYQRRRIFTFLAPDNDPLGASYHIRQSTIAIGSGGITGKGFLKGTQSHLNFLPEKHTDSIFSVIGEEWGLLGGVLILCLYCGLLVYAFRVTFQARDYFCRFAATGLTMALFLYVFINTSMVMGLMPMVGVPLPLMSYGGSASLTFLLMLGLLCNVDTSRSLRHCR